MSKQTESQSCGCGCGCGEASPARPANLPDWASAGDEELVCHCGQVSKGAIKEAVLLGAYTLPLIKSMTGACRGKDCETKNPLGRCCAVDIQELIRLYHQGPSDWMNKGPCSC
jgi:NAD(P)H-nitrite reductase large subunit